MKYSMVPLYYENMAIYLWKYEKIRWFEDFFISVLVDHLADMPIYNPLRSGIQQKRKWFTESKTLLKFVCVAAISC